MWKNKEKKEATKATIEELAAKRGTYNIKMQCKVCSYPDLIAIPKRCKPSDLVLLGQFGWKSTGLWALLDEVTGERYEMPRCHNCDCAEMRSKE